MHMIDMGRVDFLLLLAACLGLFQIAYAEDVTQECLKYVNALRSNGLSQLTAVAESELDSCTVPNDVDVVSYQVDQPNCAPAIMVMFSSITVDGIRSQRFFPELFVDPMAETLSCYKNDCTLDGNDPEEGQTGTPLFVCRIKRASDATQLAADRSGAADAIKEDLGETHSQLTMQEQGGESRISGATRIFNTLTDTEKASINPIQVPLFSNCAAAIDGIRKSGDADRQTLEAAPLPNNPETASFLSGPCAPSSALDTNALISSYQSPADKPYAGCGPAVVSWDNMKSYANAADFSDPLKDEESDGFVMSARTASMIRADTQFLLCYRSYFCERDQVECHFTLRQGAATWEAYADNTAAADYDLYKNLTSQTTMNVEQETNEGGESGAIGLRWSFYLSSAMSVLACLVLSIF